MMSSVMEEVPQLISESDLHITQLAVQLVTLMMRLPMGSSLKDMLSAVLPNIYHIVRSPLLHGKLSIKTSSGNVSSCCFVCRLFAGAEA